MCACSGLGLHRGLPLCKRSQSMSYKRGHESESLAEISRALRAGLPADAQASTPVSQRDQPGEPALAAPASKKKRRKPAAEPASTGEPVKEAAKAKVAKTAKNKRPPLDVLDAADPGETAEAPREMNDASTGELCLQLQTYFSSCLVDCFLHSKLPQAPASRVSRQLFGAGLSGEEQAPAELTFRDIYVRGFTDAHAADLEALRQVCQCCQGCIGDVACRDCGCVLSLTPLTVLQCRKEYDLHMQLLWLGLRACLVLLRFVQPMAQLRCMLLYFMQMLTLTCCYASL